MEVLRREFLPEFLNRIDEVIFFHPLGRGEIREIVDLQLAKLEQQLEEEGYAAGSVRGREGGAWPLKGTIQSTAARPLKRVIQQRLQNALANEILAGNFPEGCKIHVDTQADGFVLHDDCPRRGTFVVATRRKTEDGRRLVGVGGRQNLTILPRVRAVSSFHARMGI